MRELEFTELPFIEGNTVDYLIITTESFASEFQRLADWKTKKGIPTIIKTVEWIDQNYCGCDLQEKIRNFIQDAYKYLGNDMVFANLLKMQIFFIIGCILTSFVFLL